MTEFLKEHSSLRSCIKNSISDNLDIHTEFSRTGCIREKGLNSLDFLINYFAYKPSHFFAII